MYKRSTVAGGLTQAGQMDRAWVSTRHDPVDWSRHGMTHTIHRSCRPGMTARAVLGPTLMHGGPVRHGLAGLSAEREGEPGLEESWAGRRQRGGRWCQAADTKKEGGGEEGKGRGRGGADRR